MRIPSTHQMDLLFLCDQQHITNLLIINFHNHLNSMMPSYKHLHPFKESSLKLDHHIHLNLLGIYHLYIQNQLNLYNNFSINEFDTSLYCCLLKSREDIEFLAYFKLWPFYLILVLYEYSMLNFKMSFYVVWVKKD